MKKQQLILVLLASLLPIAGCIDDKPVSGDLCPDDPLKTSPGMCGCGVPDTDSDGDTVPDCTDTCPNDPDKTAPGFCGCGMPDHDANGDTIPECDDKCPEDPDKTEPGMCGCGVPDTDTDGDTVPDCIDRCSEDPEKVQPGKCGCGTADDDSDGDTMPDCFDKCPEDADKYAPGVCGCGAADEDSDGDTMPDCIDRCPQDAGKKHPGVCGCAIEDSSENIIDSDGDGFSDCIDHCPNNPDRSEPSAITGCDPSGTEDTDGDTIPNADDICPYNPEISTGEGGDSCNIVVENGIEIYNIYHASELAHLRERNKGLFEGRACDDFGSVHCIDGKSALRCTGARMLERMPCASCTVVPDGEDICELMPETDAHLVGEACTKPLFESKCIDTHTISYCDDDGTGQHYVKAIKCEGAGAVCNADNNKCIADVPENPVPTLGNPGDPCDPENYAETCSQDGTGALRCIDNKVTQVICETACTSYDLADRIFCLPKNDDSKVMHVRLMSDIDLADAYVITERSKYRSTWTPLELVDVDFDGGGKTIRHSKCPIEDPLFNTVSRSVIHDLNIEYNAEASAAVANRVEYSSIYNLNYHGAFSSRLNTAHSRASVLAQRVFRSRMRSIGINANITGTHADAVGIIYRVYDSEIADIHGQYGTIIGNMQGFLSDIEHRSVVDALNINVDSMQFHSNSDVIISDMTSSCLMQNSTFNIKKVTMNDDGPHSLELFNTPDGNLYKINVTVDDIHSPRFSGIDTKNRGYIKSSDFYIKNYTQTPKSGSSFYIIHHYYGGTAEQCKFKIDNIKSAASVYTFKYTYGDLIDSQISIGSIDTDGYAYLLGREISKNVINCQYIFDKVSCGYAYITKYLNENANLDRVLFKANSINAKESFTINAALSGMTISDSHFEIGELLTGNFMGFTDMSGTLKNTSLIFPSIVSNSNAYVIGKMGGSILSSAFEFNHLQGKDKAVIFEDFHPKRIADTSIHAALYSQNSGPALASAVDMTQNDIAIENFITSAHLLTYTTVDANGKASNGTRVSTPIITDTMVMPTENQAIHLAASKNFRYFSRTAADVPYPEGSEFLTKLEVTPYYDTADTATGHETVDALVTSLGGNWTTKMITDNNTAVKQPVYDVTKK